MKRAGKPKKEDLVGIFTEVHRSVYAILVRMANEEDRSLRRELRRLLTACAEKWVSEKKSKTDLH